MNKPKDLPAALVIEAIQRAEGNITTAARSLHVSRTTLYKRIASLPTAQDALTEARETLLDDAESVFYDQAIREKNITALIFLLKTQGYKRGWVERHEHSGPDGGPIQVKGYAIFSPEDWDNDAGS